MATVPVDLCERSRSLACEDKHDKPLPGQLPAGGRGDSRDSRDSPLRSTPHPLSSPPPFLGLVLSLATPPNPGLFPAPPRPRNCSRALPLTCPQSLSSRGRPAPGKKIHPECSAAARDPPPPRGLSGGSRSSRAPERPGLPLAAG